MCTRMRNQTILMSMVVAFGAMACGAKDKKDTLPVVQKETPKVETPPVKTEEPVKAEIKPVDDGPAPTINPIYFDFDSYTIQDPSKTELQKVGDYLAKHPGSTVTVAGHTDERGTTEYNLALGDQRAKAAHDYLVRLGTDPARIKTISYGKERPAVNGAGEEAWSKNRRDEFETSIKK